MRIIVCIKQVPVLSRIKFDYEKKAIVREGVPLEVNSFDNLAVSKVVDLKKQLDGEVTVITMGSPQAREASLQCLAVGADKAIHMTDRAFAGSDTLAIQRNPFDPILCGRNSNDAETGQVGPEIAEILHIPHVSNARKLDFVDDGQKVLVERVTDQGYETIRCPLPALVTVAEGISEEKFASKAELDSVQGEVVEEIGAGQLWSDQSLFGTIGSPTRVEEIRLIEPDRLGVTIEDTNPKEAARRVVAGLRDRLAARPTGAKRVDDLPRHKGNTQGAIWVMTEVTGSELRRVTFEMISKVRELAQRTQGEVVAVLVGQGAQEHVKAVAVYGADGALILGSDVVAHPASRSAAVAWRRPWQIGGHMPS